MATDPAYRTAQEHSGKQNERIEHGRALERAMAPILTDDTEVFEQFADNESFRWWLADFNFARTCE